MFDFDSPQLRGERHRLTAVKPDVPVSLLKPVQIEDHLAFAAASRVWGADPARARAMLTSTAIDTIMGAGGEDLYLIKPLDRLFVYYGVLR
jgi:hypothetical protein